MSEPTKNTVYHTDEHMYVSTLPITIDLTYYTPGKHTIYPEGIENLIYVIQKCQNGEVKILEEYYTPYEIRLYNANIIYREIKTQINIQTPSSIQLSGATNIKTPILAENVFKTRISSNLQNNEQESQDKDDLTIHNSFNLVYNPNSNLFSHPPPFTNPISKPPHTVYKNAQYPYQNFSKHQNTSHDLFYAQGPFPRNIKHDIVLLKRERIYLKHKIQLKIYKKSVKQGNKTFSTRNLSLFMQEMIENGNVIYARQARIFYEAYGINTKIYTGSDPKDPATLFDFQLARDVLDFHQNLIYWKEYKILTYVCTQHKHVMIPLSLSEMDDLSVTTKGNDNREFIERNSRHALIAYIPYGFNYEDYENLKFKHCNKNGKCSFSTEIILTFNLAKFIIPKNTSREEKAFTIMKVHLSHENKIEKKIKAHKFVFRLRTDYENSMNMVLYGLVGRFDRSHSQMLKDKAGPYVECQDVFDILEIEQGNSKGKRCIKIWIRFPVYWVDGSVWIRVEIIEN